MATNRVVLEPTPLLKGEAGTADDLDMRRICVSIWLSSLAACSTPAPVTGLGTELAELTKMVATLENQASPKGTPSGDTTASPARGSRTEVQARDATRAQPAPSRFAPLLTSELTIDAHEKTELESTAENIAALDPDRALDLILDYGKTAPALTRAIKILALMKPAKKAAIVKLLRPSEIRAVIDHRVTIAPAAKPVATTQPTPQSQPAKNASTAPTSQRFVLAGVGQTAWQTLLDTTSGVVYNYRIVDGRSRWVPITHSLLDRVSPSPGITAPESAANAAFPGR